MNRPGFLPRSMAPIAIIVLVATSSQAQTVSSADRYMGAAQASLGRTNATIASITPSYVTSGMGGSAMLGTTQSSFDRTNGMMQSMLANRAATMRGYGQHAVYRTSDNLYGVYWQNYYMRRAQMFSTYIETGHGRNLIPIDHVDRMRAIDNARRHLQQDARGQEIVRRMDLYNPQLPPNPGIFPQDVILNNFTGSDLIQRDIARVQQEASSAPSSIQRRTRGRTPGN